MRRKTILLAAFPVANAISLANFQLINSNFVPFACKVPYFAEIPSCFASDFRNACSVACQNSLLVVAQNVIRACPGIQANPKSLLEAVLEGNIIAAVCPAIIPDTASTSIEVVPTPTKTPVAPSSSTTTTKITTPEASSSTTSQAQAQTTTSSTSSVSSSGPTILNPPIIAAPTPQANSAPKPLSDPASQTAEEAAPTQAPQGNAGGGGGFGGPFDSQGGNVINGASTISGGSILALVIAACASILLG